MKHLFIINPAAGNGKSLKMIPKIEDYFKTNPESYIIEITRYPKHAAIIAEKYAKLNNYRIYSVGGDGTLNEVLNGVAGTDSLIGIIPSGSGNDFIKSLPNCNNLSNILKRTIEGSYRKIDAGKVNDKYFLNITSIGFDSTVASNTNKIKKLPFAVGEFAYILGIFYSLLKKHNTMLSIKIDDIKHIKQNSL